VSILLEALRKSEKSQRPPAPPGIHDELSGASANGLLGRGVLVSLLAMFLIASGWFAWRQYRPPVDGYRGGPNGSVTVVERPLTAVREGEDKNAAAKPERTARGQRTPVESLKSSLKNNSRSKRKNTHMASTKARNKASRKKRTVADRKQTGVLNKPLPGSAQDSGTSGSNTKPDSKSYQAVEPAPISYWELPDAVRADVPEIKFSVLVYTSRPGDRFVLIDGQRLSEGERLPSGPKIVAIRLDGVVFSYRLYRFLVAR